MTKKRLGTGLLLLPAVGLVALFAWGLWQSGGRPGGPVNTQFGEVAIQEGPAREFTLNLFDGRTLSLTDLRGKVVLVDFWASWCPPCRQEASGLAQVYREYEGRGVEFVGIDIWDTDSEAQKYLTRYDVTYPNGLDERGVIAVDYGVTGIPEKYFITPDGHLAKRFIGPMEKEKLRQVLDVLLESARSGSS